MKGFGKIFTELIFLVICDIFLSHHSLTLLTAPLHERPTKEEYPLNHLMGVSILDHGTIAFANPPDPPRISCESIPAIRFFPKYKPRFESTEGLRTISFPFDAGNAGMGFRFGIGTKSFTGTLYLNGRCKFFGVLRSQCQPGQESS